MVNSRHLKRHSMPVSWPIKRKNVTFVNKPAPGSHPRKYAISILIALRDVLGYVETAKEAKFAITSNEVLVNGNRVTSIKHAVGLFDLLELKATGEQFTLLFDQNGKFMVQPVKDNQVYLRVAKKTVQKGNVCQVNAQNGINLQVDEKTFQSLKTEDTVVYDTAKKTVQSTIPLKENAYVYIFDGKYKGHFGQITEITKYHGLGRDVVEVKIGEETHTTAKEYCFALGTKKEDMKRFQ